jgi:hypothetical protein
MEDIGLTWPRIKATLEAQAREIERLREEIAEVLVRAYKFDDKPHQLYSVIRQLALDHPSDDTPEIVRLMDEVYLRGGEASSRNCVTRSRKGQAQVAEGCREDARVGGARDRRAEGIHRHMKTLQEVVIDAEALVYDSEQGKDFPQSVWVVLGPNHPSVTLEVQRVVLRDTDEVLWP